MKKLLYKEYVLSMQPVCYIFTFLFPLLFLIPNYPLFVGTIYIIPTFSILFLGANKGKQSNDLFYSALLPVRKKDIVGARLITIISMEFLTLIIMGALAPLKIYIEKLTANPDIPIGLTSDGLVSQISLMLISYLVVNALFFLMFYRKGRSVLAPTLIGTLFHVLFILVFTVLLPTFSKGYQDVFININLSYQFIYLAAAIIIFALGSFLIYIKASRELEKVDL